jgi:hypothetical protein
MNKFHELDLETINQLSEAYRAISELPLINDTNLNESFNDFLDSCVSYSEMRSRWLLLSREEQRRVDAVRTSKHNAVLLSLTILERLCIKKGLPITWRDLIGRSEIGEERKRQGDFACYVAFVLSINAR